MPFLSFKHPLLRFIVITLILLILYWSVVETTGWLFAVYGLLPAPIWPAATIAFVGVWFWGRQAWLGVFIGAILANWLYPPEAPSLITSVWIAIGSLSAAIISVHLLKRFCGENAPFDRMQSVLIFLSFGGVLQAMIAATVGMSALYVTQEIEHADLFNLWLKWAIADAAGVLFFTPLLMMLLRPVKAPGKWAHVTEFVGVMLVLVILTWFVYWWADAQTYAIYSLSFLLIGPLAWAALRLSQIQATILLLVKETLAFSGTILGYGVLNASGDAYPIGTLGIMLVSAAVGLHIVNALVNELRWQKRALENSNHDLEQRVSERTAELVASEARMRKLATTDELTGLANRRAFWADLEQKVRQVSTRRPLSLLMLDVDYFKHINDRYGHAAGDAALRHLADILRAHTTSSGLIGRLGGEEFGVILPGYDGKSAADFAETLRLRIEVQTAGELTMTVSIGVAEVSPSEQADSLVARADNALYQAKHQGRNQVCFGE